MIRTLLKWLLLLLVVLGIIAAAAWLWLWHSKPGAQWAWNMAVEQVANSERAGKLEGRIEGTLGGQIVLRSVRYNDKGTVIILDKATLQARLDLMPVAVRVIEVSAQGVEVVIEEPGPEDEPSSLADLGDLDSPYSITVDHFLIEKGSFRRGDFVQTVNSIEGRLHWQDNAEIEVTRFDTPELTGALSVESELRQPFTLTAGANVSRFSAPESLREQLPWLPEELDASAKMSGSIEKLDLEGRLRWPEWLPSGSFEGQLNPLDSWSWMIDLSVPQLRLPEQWVEDSIGTPEVGVSGSVLVSQLSIRGEGRDDIYSVHGDAGLGASWIASESMAFELAGSASGIDRWRLAADVLVSASDWPSGMLEAEASGVGENIEARLEAPDLFGGSLSLSGKFLPGTQDPWAGQLTVNNLSIPPLLEALAPHLGESLAGQLGTTIDLLQAETLTTTIEATGSLEPFTAFADVKNLATGVRHRPISATGKLEIDETSIRTPGFSILSGESNLHLDGQLDGTQGLSLDVNIADLDDFFPGFAGTLSGQIEYRHDPDGDFTKSWLRTSMRGENLRFDGWRISELVIDELDPISAAAEHAVFEGANARSPIALGVEARDVTGPPGNFPTVSARILGRIDNMAMAVAARTLDTDVTTELSAMTIGESFDAWQGTLHQLTIDPPRGYSWTLSAPAGFRYQDGIRLESACLAANDAASMCVDVERKPDGSELGNVSLADFSPDLFGAMTDWPAKFSQQMSGSLSWTRSADSQLSAQADLIITPGAIIDQSTGAELLQSGEGTLKFLIEDNSLVAGTLNIPLDSGRIDVEFALPDLLQNSETELDGRIRVDLETLEALSAFIPNLAQVAGELAVDLQIAGTPQNPRFSGTTSLKEGRFSLPATGLRLSKLEISGEMANDNQVRLDGTFLAGSGTGRLQAQLDISQPLEPSIQAHLTGQAMTLINVPDMRLDADTDMRIELTGQDLSLLGTLHVPTARFAPRYLPSDTASESPDVVLVSNGEPIRREEEKSSEWTIHGDLAVSLGNNVVIDLELARATATGAAMFSWRGDVIPIANGEYNIRGDIQAYGQTLEITKAAIRYPNVSADSPYLDVRAERTIYGNSLVTKAGVLVNGTLKRPQTEPYTVPATNADRARALLITGSDFNYEQGVGAVNVGTYIAPKLYLSYGVGLFEEGNVITARYELKRNFGVKATSGQDETGLDISYTIER